MTMRSVNPATGEIVKEYEKNSPKEVERILSGAADAQKLWKETTFARRRELMEGASEQLRKRKDKLAELMALEMGKPLAQGRGEVEKCAWVCDYYAEHAEEFLRDEPAETDATKSYVAYRPLGAVLAVMPWNFPFWQVFRFAAPNLMAGNVGLLKHASNVPGCALAIQDVFRDAGFPEGVFASLLVGSNQVEPIIQKPHIRACTLTGSTPAGRAVAEASGRALKKTVLELGGSDPYLILEDADLPAAAKVCATSRLINSGQSCIAAKRFLVMESVYQQFTDLLAKAMSQHKMGDPMKEGIDVGPQARVDLRDDLHRQVQQSVEKGAEILLGGSPPPGPGAFYPPTVLKDVTKGMPAFDEELFGPVAAVTSVPDQKTAVQLANDTVFGLGAAVFTQNTARGERIAADELEAGACFVNTFVKSDPRLPFGGVKTSGYGRELGRQGILEFVNTKTVYLA